MPAQVVAWLRRECRFKTRVAIREVLRRIEPGSEKDPVAYGRLLKAYQRFRARRDQPNLEQVLAWLEAHPSKDPDELRADFWPLRRLSIRHALAHG